ncbi:MAG: dynamin family protein [Thermoanaerobaculia bacterium]|nr:dynamin family protein [Thermoanaerobaculia bacterium]
MQKVLSDTARRLLIEERDLLARLEAALSRFGAAAADREALAAARRQLDELFLLVVVGEYNSGKSAFLNALLGGRFLAEGATPTTDQIHVVAYGPEKTVEQIRPSLRRLTFPVPWLQEINVVDTPGTNSVIREHQEITEAFVPRADLILFVTSADRPFSESEKQFLTGVRAWGKKIVIVINKIDILEDAGAVGEVTDFVRQQATILLGLSPILFPVSIRQAQQAQAGDPNEAQRLLKASGFPALEKYIVETLDENERLALKLESPLGVAERLVDNYSQAAVRQQDLLAGDLTSVDQIQTALDGYAADSRHDFEFRLSRIDNILHDLHARGDRFFEEMIRPGRFFDLINAARLRAEFERQVIGDIHQQLETEVGSLIDWMVDRDHRQWQGITRQLAQRAGAHGDRIVGEIGGEFVSNRQNLLTSVGRTARDVVRDYDKDKEARRLAETVQNGLAIMGAVELGALGLGALLLHVMTRALDPLGIVAAGGIAILGLYILPARRRKAKADFDRKIEEIRTRMRSAMAEQFEREISNSLQRIREAVSPFTRFVRSESDRLEELREELTGVASGLRSVRDRIRV